MRILVNTTIMIALLCFLTGCGKTPVITPSKNFGFKHMVVIAIDTLAAQNLHFMGYDRETAPFIDELASQSIVMNKAYTPKALTLPSFTSFFTAMHPISHNVMDNGVEIPDQIPSLVMRFQQSGFYTAGFPAAHMISTHWGCDRGFDFYNDVDGHDADSLLIDADEVQRRVEEFFGNQEDDFDLSDPDTRLFLFVHFFDTHTDYNPDPQYLQMFADPDYDGPVDGTVGLFGQYNKSEIEFDDADYQHARDLYDADIRTTDDYVKRLYDYLDSLGILQDTLIVFTADHGENLGEHGYITHGHPYESGLHVPLFFRFPDDSVKPERIEQLVEITDLVPTLMEFAGIEQHVPTDGHSFASLIDSGQFDSSYEREYSLAAGAVNRDEKRDFSITDGEYRYFARIGRSNKPFVYDITKDPKEQVDISDDNPELVSKYAMEMRILTEWARPAEEPQYDAETEEMLRSLGYLH